MSCQKPVVVFDSGGIPEIIDHAVTGFLVRPGNIMEMASFIQKILIQPSLGYEMGKAGYRKVEQYYTVKRHYQLMEKVYDDLLSEKPKQAIENYSAVPTSRSINSLPSHLMKCR
jgi:glycosyltransferase involved in cell wall biosynthesis